MNKRASTPPTRKKLIELDLAQSLSTIRWHHAIKSRTVKNGTSLTLLRFALTIPFFYSHCHSVTPKLTLNNKLILLGDVDALVGPGHQTLRIRKVFHGFSKMTSNYDLFLSITKSTLRVLCLKSK